MARTLTGDLARARRRRGDGLFGAWENRRIARGQAALIDPKMLRNIQLRDGVSSFFFLYLVQGGIFFVVPLFLSVALGLSAVATGMHLLPLSLTLLLFAAGVPKLLPNANPRRVIRLGFMAMFAGLVLLLALLDYGAGAEIVTWPLLLAGAGIGSIASQLGSVTVSAVPDEQSGEVGGIQNTGTQLGASIGTALAGAVLISALSARFSPASRTTRSSPIASPTGTDEPGRRCPVHIRRRPQSRALGRPRPPAQSRRDRADQRAKPHRRAPRRRRRSSHSSRSSPCSSHAASQSSNPAPKPNQTQRRHSQEPRSDARLRPPTEQAPLPQSKRGSAQTRLETPEPLKTPHSVGPERTIGLGHR